MSKKEEKKDYSDLEKEHEEELYYKTKWAKISAKYEAEKSQWVKDALAATNRDYRRAKSLDDWLFTRYCSRNNLTDAQIEALLKREEFDKMLHNAPLNASSFNHLKEISPGEYRPHPEKTGISHFESECDVWETEVPNFTCEWVGCQKETNLVVMIFNVDQKAFCREHWEELKAILKKKPKEQW
jgi:hypothetical protein